MGASAIKAIRGLIAEYKIPATNIGVTISIGRNDNPNSVVTAADLAAIAKYAVANKVAAVHIASLDRDRSCRAGEALAACSGAALGPLGFINALVSALTNDALNPCTIGNGGSSGNATCAYSAILGQTACTCKAGYVGNGATCEQSELPLPSRVMGDRLLSRRQAAAAPQPASPIAAVAGGARVAALLHSIRCGLGARFNWRLTLRPRAAPPSSAPARAHTSPPPSRPQSARAVS